MKKAISLFLITLITLSLMSATLLVYAGHCGGLGLQRNPRYSLCSVEDCDIVGPHLHDGAWYCNQNGGWSVEVCSEEDCTQLGIHEHDGERYSSAYRGTGMRCGRGWKR